MNVALIISVLILILTCLLAFVIRYANYDVKTGGNEVTKSRANARRRKILESNDLVVDTLNLVHWLGRRNPSLKMVETCSIVSAIDETAPILRQKYSGKIVYVLKDRETRVNDPDQIALTRATIGAAAKRNNVSVAIVERPRDPVHVSHAAPEHVNVRDRIHAALGRDDFYMIYLAHKLRCPVLSRDRFRDLSDMKAGHLDRFNVFEYSPLRVYPKRDYVNPSAPEFRQMKRPVTVDYADALPIL